MKTINVFSAEPENEKGAEMENIITTNEKSIFEKLIEKGVLFVSDGNIFDENDAQRSAELAEKALKDQILELSSIPRTRIKLWGASKSINRHEMANLMMSERRFFPRCRVKTFVEGINEYINIFSDNPGWFIGYATRSWNISQVILCRDGLKAMINSIGIRTEKSKKLRMLIMDELETMRVMFDGYENQMGPTIRRPGCREIVFINLEPGSSLFFHPSEEKKVREIISENSRLVSHLSDETKSFIQV